MVYLLVNILLNYMVQLQVILHITNHAGPSVWAAIHPVKDMCTILHDAPILSEINKFLPLPGFEPGSTPVVSCRASH